jgi:ATP-dependent 26S proteasome regulatory subunit
VLFGHISDLTMFPRYDAHSGGEREIQRTMLELLNQLDGFDSRGDVKVILATVKIVKVIETDTAAYLDSKA